MNTEKHKSNVEHWNENKRKSEPTIHQLSAIHKKNNISSFDTGGYIEEDIHLYRANMLQAAYTAKVSMKQLTEMRPIIEKHTLKSLGNPKHLPETYSELLKDKIKEYLQEIFGKSFPEFSVIFDGTPSFA